jgi:hypothetical protein
MNDFIDKRSNPNNYINISIYYFSNLSIISFATILFG